MAGAAVAVPAREPKPTASDRASARIAIRAWRDYFAAVVASTPEARPVVDDFVASVAAGCPGVLARLDAEISPSSDLDAIGTFLTEIFYDTDLVSVRRARVPLPALVATVAGLRWSSQT